MVEQLLHAQLDPLLDVGAAGADRLVERHAAPTAARIALSATSLIVASRIGDLEAKSSGSLMFQRTE